MTTFLVALAAVGVLLISAVPGYVLLKKKMIGEACIPGLSKILLYACQPCLAVYTFQTIEWSGELGLHMLTFAGAALLLQAMILGGAYLILHKKCKEAIYRIVVIGMGLANCAFFGIPIIEALIPEVAREVLVYTTVYAFVMNILGWTVCSAIIANDVKYMRPKNIVFNPAMIGTAVALLLCVLGIRLPTELSSMVTSFGKCCTPLSMMIMGMRLATVNFRSMLGDARVYLTLAVKQFAMPIISFLLLLLLPMGVPEKQTLFIIAACPAASIVLNFSEIVGQGQKEAASIVLLSTITSIISIPIVMLLLPLI